MADTLSRSLLHISFCITLQRAGAELQHTDESAARTATRIKKHCNTRWKHAATHTATHTATHGWSGEGLRHLQGVTKRAFSASWLRSLLKLCISSNYSWTRILADIPTQIDWHLKIQNTHFLCIKFPPLTLSPLHSTRGHTATHTTRRCWTATQRWEGGADTTHTATHCNTHCKTHWKHTATHTATHTERTMQHTLQHAGAGRRHTDEFAAWHSARGFCHSHQSGYAAYLVAPAGVALCCNVLQCVAIFDLCCNVLLCVAMCCSVLAFCVMLLWFTPIQRFCISRCSCRCCREL